VVVRPRQPAGAPAAVHCGGENGEARSSGGAAWYGERNGVVGSGGGRPEVERRRRRLGALWTAMAVTSSDGGADRGNGSEGAARAGEGDFVLTW
jgi:alkylation response protein AidB-like acyl-CoA dehydrogenase